MDNELFSDAFLAQNPEEASPRESLENTLLDTFEKAWSTFSHISPIMASKGRTVEDNKTMALALCVALNVIDQYDDWRKQNENNK